MEIEREESNIVELDVSGRDELTVIVDVAIVVLGGVMLLFGFARPILGFGFVLGLAGLVMASAIAAGARYRLTISDAGIDVVFRRAWVVRSSRLHFGLDAEIELYEAWESPGPEGISVRPRFGSGVEASPCFGPHFDEGRICALQLEAAQALFRARARNTSPRELQFQANPELHGALEGSGRRFWDSGRLRNARLAHSVQTGGVTLAAGTELELNGDGYLDPRTPDQLRVAILAVPTKLPFRDSPMAQAGARLHFDCDGTPRSVRLAFPDGIRLGRARANGLAALSWDDSGVVIHFELLEGITVGPIEIPAGSRFSRWNVGFGTPVCWYVVPSSTIAFPQFKLGSAMLISQGLERILSVLPAKDLEIEGRVLLAGRQAIPLDANAKVDFTACKKRGLIGARK